MKYQTTQEYMYIDSAIIVSRIVREYLVLTENAKEYNGKSVGYGTFYLNIRHKVNSNPN